MAPPNEVSVIIRAKDFASKVVGKFQQTLKGITRTALNVGRMLFRLGAAGGAAVAAIGRLAQQGGEVVGVQRAFNRVMGDGEQALRQLRNATRGLVSDYQLMKQANTAFSTGAARTTEEMENLFRLSQDLGRALGIDATTALEKATVAIARQSRLRADDLGIILSQTEANERYAEALGTTVDALTEAQKKEAFRAEFLRKGRELVDELGTSNVQGADAVNRLVTEMRNLTDAFKVMLAQSPAVMEFFEEWTAILQDLSGERIEVDAVVAGVQDLPDDLNDLVAQLNQARESVQRLRRDRAGIPGSTDPTQDPRGFSRRARRIEITEAIQEEEAKIGALERRILAISRGQFRALNAEAEETGGTIGAAAGRTMAEAFSDRLSSDPILAEIVGQGRSFRRQQVEGQVSAAFRFQGGGEMASLTGLNRTIAGGGGSLRLGDRAREAGAAAEAAGEGLANAGEIAAETFFRTADAAIRGTATIEGAFVNMISSVLSQVGGGGITGTILGGFVGLVGSFFDRGSKPMPVRVEDFSSRAESKMNRRTGPERVQVLVTTTEGTKLVDVEHDLNRRSRRDASSRIPAGVSLG